MQDISSKIFIIYAWEDTARVNSILKECEYEINAKLTADIDTGHSPILEDKTTKAIEDAKVVMVFISDAAKKSDYVKAAVTYSLNVNKNILPVNIDKRSMFGSMPEEFKFRAKPYNINDDESKNMLIAQLKATLGINIENGDEFGTLIHIVTDRNAKIMRYGEDLGTAEAGKDCKIRLANGYHRLEFIDTEDPTIRCIVHYNVEDNVKEQYLEVPIMQRYEQKLRADEKAKREEEIKRQFEEQNYKKNLEIEQRNRELELKQREREAERIHQRQLQAAEEERKRKQREAEEEERQRQEEEMQRQKEEGKKKSKPSGCLIIILIFLGIAFPVSLIFSIPYLIYKYKD